ncbi:hypothetical protein HHI36_009481 [Cryptolaemus montrouzieri]|uniref:Secreted protein n=1 Tax=Cryptolaemus montrouzieri TaxID=559131 RepID=A0ABD2MFS7_9CUCU
MKCVASFACFSVLLVVIYAAPAPQGTSIQGSVSVQGGTAPSRSPIGGLTNILQNIDLPGLLRGINSFVGLVRQFCPPLSQILDNVIQNVTSQAFRIFGRAILQNGGLGGGAAGGTQRVNVVLPTFPPDDDYDDEEEDTSEEAVNLAARSGNIQESTTPSSANENAIAKRHVRVAREAETDQELAESAPEPQDDLSNVDTESDSDRGKRFLPFGGDGHGGGSGNFLFDIIRVRRQPDKLQRN